MKVVNWLLKVLGGFLTSYSFVTSVKAVINPAVDYFSSWTIIILLAVGLALLFGPEVE